MASSDVERLEALWGGEFGDEYVDRNLGSYDARRPFWEMIVAECAPASVCEVGCNVGGNLQWITPPLPAARVIGVDVNHKALSLLRDRIPGVRGFEAAARQLPFPERSIELVFTMGVLIHQPEESLPAVMDEMVRVASRYVLCGEYADDETVEVHYRGHEGALFRRDYGGLFLQRFEEQLTLARQGFLSPDEGFDNLTWWLFERK